MVNLEMHIKPEKPPISEQGLEISKSLLPLLIICISHIINLFLVKIMPNTSLSFCKNQQFWYILYECSFIISIKLNVLIVLVDWSVNITLTFDIKLFEYVNTLYRYTSWSYTIFSSLSCPSYDMLRSHCNILNVTICLQFLIADYRLILEQMYQKFNNRKLVLMWFSDRAIKMHSV